MSSPPGEFSSSRFLLASLTSRRVIVGGIVCSFNELECKKVVGCHIRRREVQSEYAGLEEKQGMVWVQL